MRGTALDWSMLKASGVAQWIGAERVMCAHLLRFKRNVWVRAAASSSCSSRKAEIGECWRTEFLQGP